MRYRKGSSGKLVGHCLDLPFITVQGNTPDELVQKIYHDIDVYFTTFPEKGMEFLKKYGTVVTENVVVGIEASNENSLPPASQEWQQKEVMCTIPA